MTSEVAARGSTARHLASVSRYYRSGESLLGYSYLLGGTKHFGYYAPGDPGWRLHPAMRRMEDQLAERLALPPGAVVLDAGCGVGDVAARLAGVHGLHVTGIDILDFNLATARERARARGLAGRTAFLEMDYAALAFPDGSFDGAYTMETLVHSDNVERVLHGLHRVLRPGGRLVLFEYSRTPEAHLTPRAARVLREVNEGAAMPGFQRLAHGLLEQLLADAGFVDVAAEDLTARMLPMLRVFARLGWLPYHGARLLGRADHAVNAMSGVELYRHREAWRYQAYTCRKPDAS
jgi:sterol 24-C-methyltransferase